MEGVAPGRTFVLVTNQAQPSAQIPLDDLPGEGGRFDLVARFVNAALLTSHGIREEAAAVVVFTRPEEPVAMRVRGEAATGIGPDERSTAARLVAALEATPMPVWQAVEDGIDLRVGGLHDVLAEAPEPVVLLHEEGQRVERGLAGGTFVVGDHEGFTEEQLAELDAIADQRLQLGPEALQADHVAAVLHHELDR